MRVFGFAGWSGSGKTTLIERLLPLLRQQGLRVATIKHVHHAVDLDIPGKDSWRHRQAGAEQVAIVSQARLAILSETPHGELRLEQVLTRLAPVDLVLIEGFKRHPIPKIEVHRIEQGGAWLHPDDPTIIALATNASPRTSLPVLALDDLASLVTLVQKHAVCVD